MRLPLTLAALCLAAFYCTALSAAPAVEVVPSAQGARLLVGGNLITIFRKPNGGLSPAERAEVAAERLRLHISEGLRPQQVEARDRGPNWGLYANGNLIMIATDEEADARNEMSKMTATRWAQNLKQALAAAPKAAAKPAAPKAAAKPAAVAKPAAAAKAPPRKAPVRAGALAAEVQSLPVPVGETRTVGIKGSATGPISVSVDDSDTVTARVVPGKAEVEVAGVAPGSATVRVSRGGKETTFRAWVKQYAGRVSTTASAGVTGSVSPASMVGKAAREALQDGIEREPGAVVSITGEPQGVRALGRGESTQVTFPVTITGGDAYLPVKTTARVRVENRSLTPQRTQALLYSNDPESVREFGTLYEGVVENGGPARLLYHHQNRMNRPFVFQIHLVNPHSEPVEVQVVQGESGPFIDTIQVGHRAGERYLNAHMKDLGYIGRVPARGSRVVYSSKVEHLLTVSGIFQFRVTDGGPLAVLVTVSPEGIRPPVRDDLLATARNEPHIYSTAQKDIEANYDIGSTWAFVPLGKTAVTGRNPNRKLFGNYGVIYNVTVTVRNPTSEDKTVRVMMAPDAGWARGVFAIDGRLIEAPQVAPPTQAELYTVVLRPGEQRRLSIQSIPVGGSAYPISLVVRS
jgi:hypothetical protein